MPKSNFKSHLPLIVGAILWLIALIFASIYDLDISLAVADPMSALGRVLEIVGEVPAILFTSFNFILMSAYFALQPEQNKQSRAKHGVTLFLAIGTAYYTTIRTFIYIADYRSDLTGDDISVGILEILISAVICAAVVAVMYFAARRLGYERLTRVYSTAVACVKAAVTTLLVIWLIKLVWGRVRFRQLEGDLSRFTPWYLPQGITGYFSFPSGHTANAAVIFTSAYYLNFLPENKRIQRAAAYIALALWVILLAASRVLVGAHYLSDVLFGAAITFVIVDVWRPKCQAL